MPVVDGLRVVRSPIQGYGVIATRPFGAGAVVAEVEGVVWRAGEAVDDRYSLEIEPGLFLDMVDQTRFVNHSCEPNVTLRKGVVEGEPWARLVALRDLRPGEELTYDYAFSEQYAEPCRCGSASCCGRIVDRAPTGDR